MFDISWTELLVIGVVALIAIGPKELPRVLYELGKGVRRVRAFASEFQRHVSDMMHETELDELRRRAQAARDLTNPRSLAELVDPGGTLRYGLDPTATGHPGSPVEHPMVPPLPAPPVGTSVDLSLPPAAVPVEGRSATASPADGTTTGSGRG